MNNWIKTCRARTSPSVVRLRHSPVPLALAIILLSIDAALAALGRLGSSGSTQQHKLI